MAPRTALMEHGHFINIVSHSPAEKNNVQGVRRLGPVTTLTVWTAIKPELEPFAKANMI